MKTETDRHHELSVLQVAAPSRSLPTSVRPTLLGICCVIETHGDTIRGRGAEGAEYVVKPGGVGGRENLSGS